MYIFMFLKLTFSETNLKMIPRLITPEMLNIEKSIIVSVKISETIRIKLSSGARIVFYPSSEMFLTDVDEHLNDTGKSLDDAKGHLFSGVETREFSLSQTNGFQFFTIVTDVGRFSIKMKMFACGLIKFDTGVKF